MSIETPVYAARPYETGFEPMGLNVPEAIGDIRFVHALKPTSLGVVKQLRLLLPDSMDVIAYGGVSTAIDVRGYKDAGASAVQMAAAIINSGLYVFENILKASRIA